MSIYTQHDRRLLLSTPLGEDALLCTAFEGDESLSRPFRFRLALVSERPSIAARDLVGRNVTFGIRRPDGDPRHFNGIVRSFSYHGTDDRLSLYSAEIVPWFWLLTRTTDCRIFQNKSIPDIVTQIFHDLGLSDFERQLSAPHPKLDYCVQYRETDFDFVSRLLEHAGIFYFFRHENGKHVMVLADSRRAYKDAHEREVAFAPNNLSEVDATDLVTSWEHRYEFTAGRSSHTDYNFETPAANLAAAARTLVKLDNVDKFDLYDYPGLYAQKPDGDALAKVRIEAEEAAHETVVAASRCRTFGPGLRFKLASHHNPAEEGKSYVVTHIRHKAAQPGAYVSGGAMPPEEYTNDFTCIPDSVTFRPPRLTPKPTVRGCQTAVVVGPAGQEIHTDKFGRVKVQFHWDREGKKDDHSSCWIRVAQSWAGKNWGALFLPRIGHEVLVDFLEGDPDRPLITGAVYNAENMPPYPLPDEKTKSTIKSNSTIGSGGFNEIRFDDKKGSEQIFVHGQKDLEYRIENDRLGWVGRDLHLYVKNDYHEHVDGERHEEITKSHFEHIGGDRNTTVDKSDVTEIKGNQTHNVTGDVVKEVQKSQSLKVAKDLVIKADQIVIEADTNITLKVGGSYIAIEDGGIKLHTGQQMEIESGSTTDIKSTGALNIESSASATLKANAPLTLESSATAELKSPKTAIKGDGMTEITGGLVKIN